MRIMMSAAGSPQAVGIIKYLKNLGHYVIGHDMQPFAPGMIFAHEWHTSPPVYRKEYLDLLISVLPELYLPFLDEELELVTSFNTVLVSPRETIEIFTSKILQQQMMEGAGLPVAPAFDNIVIKPDVGRGGKGIIKPGSMHGYVFQREIIGDEYTIDVLTDMDGGFLYAVPRQRIATSGGVSTIGLIKMDQKLIDLARQVCGKFHFRGPINIQVIREDDSGKDYIIEVNPRLSGSCMFTVEAGWDILRATINLWQGQPFAPPSKVWEVHVRRYFVEVKL